MALPTGFQVNFWPCRPISKRGECVVLLRPLFCTFRELVAETVRSEAGVVLTTYEGLRAGREHLLNVRWGYAVLDEGHKIRNPDTEITLVAKQLPTLHR